MKSHRATNAVLEENRLQIYSLAEEYGRKQFLKYFRITVDVDGT